MTRSFTSRNVQQPVDISLAEFDVLFDRVRNWERWGPTDRVGTLNLITAARVREAAGLVRIGRHVSMQVPIDTAWSLDNQSPAIHSVTQWHDSAVGSDMMGFATDFFGIACHGDRQTHVDALNHVSYKGFTYNGRVAATILVGGDPYPLDVDAFRDGLVGKGVLLDVARLRGVEWLEPGEAVTRSELEACETAENVHLAEGDILVFRTGHQARRARLGPRSAAQPPAGEGRAGLHVDAIPWMHERGVAAFLSDFDGEAVPSTVTGMPYPIHVLQIAAMGMLTGDLLQLEELALVCDAERRWEFMVVAAPLRLPNGTGTPWNPIALF